MPSLSPYQLQFIDFMMSSGALRFGEFTLKSGRQAPYFINLGNFKTGRQMETLAGYYAAHIRATYGQSFNVIFGPAYKGIPLAIASSMVIDKERDVYFSFNRKEAKTRGEGGMLVGKQLEPGDKVIIVEDVITAGTTFSEVVPMLRSYEGVTVIGAVIAVDRCERGEGNRAARQQIEETLSIEISPIVTIHDILAYLGAERSSAAKLPQATLDSVRAYLAEYGAPS